MGVTKDGGRVYQHTYHRECRHCNKRFETWCRAAHYCAERCRTDAATARRDRRPGNWLTVPIPCGVCQTPFLRTKQTGPNRKYCSPECIMRARRRDHLRHKKLFPGAMAAYNKTRAANHGPDQLMARVRKKYPALPTSCQAAGCTEGRVLDIAHRPSHKRNGTFRTLGNCQPHMIWVLCPTHHALIDRGVCTPAECGLVE